MSQAAVTPNRKTRIIYDVPETVCTAPVWYVKRRGADICGGLQGGGADTAKFSNCKIWPSGAITLTPIQAEISNLSEYAVGLPHVIGNSSPNLLAGFDTATSLSVENRYRLNSDLPGFVASSAIAAAGAPYIVKQVPAGQTWDDAVISGVPSMLGNALDIPIDRVGEGRDTFPADQAFFLSWSVPGAGLSFPNFTLGFYFGEYGIAFSGSGTALLYENTLAAADNTFSWKLVDSWRYARTGQLSGTTHSMQIWPHLGPTGAKNIAFTNGQVDIAQRISSFSRSNATAVAPGDHVFTAKYNPLYKNQSPGHVTMAGPIRFDVRRDIRLELQISTLGFPLSGYVIDDPATLPPQNPHLPLVADADTTIPTGTTLTASLIDSDTRLPFDSTLDGARHCQARFDFTSDGTTTPILWGYGLRRDPQTTLVSPGTFSGGNIQHINISGYSGDPAQQTASVAVKDIRGELPRLVNRGQIRANIVVDHTEGGVQYTTPIFSGYVMRPEGAKAGRPGRAYPSPGAFNYNLSLQGMWTRLAEQVSGPTLGEVFAKEVDPFHPYAPGPGVPWKVTDALKYLLGAAGFAPAQIDLPDYEARCWFGTNSSAEELTIQPGTDYCEMAMQLCRNYLGLHLCYAEELDAWVLITPPPDGAAPLYNFVTAPAPQGKISTAPGAYGPLTTFIAGSLRFQVIKPEFNCVHVLCPVLDGGVNNKNVAENWTYNYASAPMNGATNLPDPDSPEFVGRMLTVQVIDPSLYIDKGADSAAATQGAVDWTARRIYNFCCHAQRLAFFHAPLIFVLDPLTGLYRMPRFLDPITINGVPYVVKCCNPDYTLDHMQMASYECIQPYAGQYVPPGIEALSFFRKSDRQQAAKATGMATEGHRLGGLSVSPQAEHSYRHLPRNIAYQRPLQDPATGEFFFMLGFDALGSAPLSP